MRKNIQEKFSKMSDFFNQKRSKNTKKCIFWVQKSKIFPGEGPRTPHSLAGFACFFASWQKFLRRTLMYTLFSETESISAYISSVCTLTEATGRGQYGEGNVMAGIADAEGNSMPISDILAEH